MALTSAYTQAYGKLNEFFGKIRDGQSPPQFTHQLLKDLGYKSNSHRAYIPILKALGFLTPDGKPTPIYSDYRDHSNSKRIMGEALKKAYSDIFLIKENPTTSDKAAIKGKFKSFHNTSDTVAKHMTSTLYALLALADLKPTNFVEEINTESVSEGSTEQNTNSVVQPHSIASGLHYNIQIHLPATKDIEVYNAIFKSLKEHLY